MDVSYISEYYWDQVLPVRTDKIAHQLGCYVFPIDISENADVSLMLRINDNVLTIGYNPTDSAMDIRKVIAFGLVKYSNKKVCVNETLTYGKDIFTSAIGFIDFYDMELAKQLLMPYKTVIHMVRKAKVYEVEKLANIFDVSIEDMLIRLKDLGLLS